MGLGARGMRAPGAMEEIVMEFDLEQARRRAKELLRAARAGDQYALAQMRDDRAPRLADAQRAIARQLGFSSWPALVDHEQATVGDREERRMRLVSAALDGRADVAEQLLARDPALADAGLDVALVLGDPVEVAAALERDQALVARELPGVGLHNAPQAGSPRRGRAKEHRRRPLSCVCHSLLLDHGADVNDVHHNEYGAMSVLYGASGVAHDPETTRLLLGRGADPNDGESVYHAVEGDDTICLELLLGAGATVRGTNALANAIEDPAKVAILLEQGDLSPSDPELRDALLHARAPAVIKLLIEHGASLDARDPDGLTPYARAARFKSEEAMRQLEAAGARTELDPAAEWIGAIVRGDRDRAARVKARHPDVALRDADLEQLPRWASAGDDEVVEQLLDAGVPIDARGADGGTALHYAALWGRATTAARLLARGADPEAWSAPGPALGTPLSWASWGSRNASKAAERLDAYLATAVALTEAGAWVTEGMIDVAADELSVLLQAEAERTGILRVTALSYMPGRPVRIRIRHREHRYYIDDLGTAVAIAGRPPDWRDAAERTVRARNWNINHDGVVSMQAVERRRNVDELINRTAETSVAVLDALLELRESTE
jgi:ankyrin repeat protein